LKHPKKQKSGDFPLFMINNQLTHSLWLMFLICSENSRMTYGCKNTALSKFLQSLIMGIWNVTLPFFSGNGRDRIMRSRPASPCGRQSPITSYVFPLIPCSLNIVGYLIFIQPSTFREFKEGGWREHTLAETLPWSLAAFLSSLISATTIGAVSFSSEKI